ncbi:MAG TPA: sugar phosphate isomerase/epimerase [Candidatus Brocadiia bacterium]|nr:sugar phosphate isomerase/epimerase [Candidatus Brocadiia bacterium]
MIKLGANSVLFGAFDLKTAMKHLKMAGYDGVELSAIKGMCEHLNLDDWKSQAADIRKMSQDFELELLSMEEAGLDLERLKLAFEAGAEIGIPIINIGPGGKKDVEEDFQRQTDLMIKAAEMAEGYGVTLCCKAHVGGSIYNTATTLRALEKIKSPAFGCDMDPSHIHREGDTPSEALKQVISRVKHIHIRDCLGRQQNPGKPENQACGRGDIDLLAYVKVLVDAKWSGPVCLEVIGAGNYELPQVVTIAAETRGFLNACLKACGAR